MSRPADPSAAVPFDDVYDLVEQVLRTGLVLAALVDDLPEVPTELVLELVAGSAHPAATALGPTAVREATALIGALSDRIVADLAAASA